MGHKVATSITIVVFLLGYVIGSISTEPTVVAGAVQIVPGPVVTKRVEIAPKSCITAFDAADKALVLYESDVQAVINLNYDKAMENNVKLAVQQDLYNASQALCRATRK